MNSFSIGLALVIAGVAGYFIQPEFVKWASAPDMFELLKPIAESAWTWICILTIALGVIWFWVLGPLLAFTSPRKSE